MHYKASAERAGKAGAQQQDIYERITNLMIERLQEGRIPWKQPWGHSEFHPKNYVTKRPYSGFNALLLAFSYTQPFYLTFNQVKELGGAVIKGSKSLPVVYYDRTYYLKSTGQKITSDEARLLPRDAYTAKPFMKYYNVFNVSQVEGIEFDLPIPKTNDIPIIDTCERIWSRMPGRPKLITKGQQACYVPPLDQIWMPHRELFHQAEGYYATLFHEMIHSTGHSLRLNRKEVTEAIRFGSCDYSKEELVAELGSCFLMSHAGCENQITMDNAAAYINGWISKLQSDPKFLLEASGKASRAVEFILNEGV